MRQPWRNWARTEHATPAVVTRPGSAAAVAAVVRRAAARGLTVKAIGSGHSFTGVAVAQGVQIRTEALDHIEVDRVTGLARVGAGVPLHRLNRVLAEHDRALEILGDIDRQTIAGAVSTGTHGSGAQFRSIGASVQALELVSADGSVRTCSRTEHPELFDAARLGLGALGVITSLTLRTVPLYRLHALDTPMPLDHVLDNLDDLLGYDHFEFFWFPHTSTALTRRFTRLPGTGPLRPQHRLAKVVDDHLITNTGLGAALALGSVVPGTIPAITRLITAAIGEREVVDLAPRVFASVRRVRFREGEYAIPRGRVVGVLRQIRTWVHRHREPVSFPLEVRFARSEDAWLSPAYGADVAYIAFHQYHRLPHERWFAACEDILTAAGGRPHWGKMHRWTAADLAGTYPRFADFVALRDRLDPSGMFANPYLDRVLGPVAR